MMQKKERAVTRFISVPPPLLYRQQGTKEGAEARDRMRACFRGLWVKLDFKTNTCERTQRQESSGLVGSLLLSYGRVAALQEGWAADAVELKTHRLG